jgi:hypothetical protein
MGKVGFKEPSKGQIVALQSLYSKWQAHSIQDAGDQRAARLSWASESVGRAVSSFKELTSDEARRLIDVLKESMGQKLTRQPRPWRRIRESTRDSRGRDCWPQGCAIDGYPAREPGRPGADRRGPTAAGMDGRAL